MKSSNRPLYWYWTKTDLLWTESGDDLFCPYQHCQH